MYWTVTFLIIAELRTRRLYCLARKKNAFQFFALEIETQMQRTNVWIPRGKEGGRMNWEIGIDIYTLLYTK